MSSTKLAHFSPGRTIFFAMFATILVGTLGLALPFSRTTAIPLIDLFFTATSATCVTGLFTIPLDSFTFFGQCIILALIQIGGLGIITLMLFIMTFFLDLGLATQLMAGKLLEVESWQNIKQIIVFIIGLTVATELVGALIMFPLLIAHFPLGEALFLSIFHAVSSFCNAGIQIFPNQTMLFASSYLMVLTTSFLIFAGGLGFMTWYEIIHYITRKKNTKLYTFSLQSKIIFKTTAVIICVGTMLFWLLEYNHSLATYSYPFSFVTSLFYAISFRGAGFVAFPLANMQMATLLLMMIISFIGSSPVSTGSGIKVTTLTVFLFTVKAALFGRTSVDIKGRKIPRDLVYKAIAIVAISAIWLLAAIFLLLVLESHRNFLDVMFEVVAAFTTLGISLGITSSLSMMGKCLIMLCMIIGRIGSFTLLVGLRFAKQPDLPEFSYPTERVILS